MTDRNYDTNIYPEIFPALNIAKMQVVTDSAGPGRRFVLWFQGCQRTCPGCINAPFLPLKTAQIISVDSLFAQIMELCQTESSEKIEGITLTGGEPLLQAEALLPLLAKMRETGLSVVCYTGYDYDELKKEMEPVTEPATEPIAEPVAPAFRSADDSASEQQLNVSSAGIPACERQTVSEPTAEPAAEPVAPTFRSAGNAHDGEFGEINCVNPLNSNSAFRSAIPAIPAMSAGSAKNPASKKTTVSQHKHNQILHEFFQYIDLLIDGEFRKDLPRGGTYCASANQKLRFLTNRYSPNDIKNRPESTFTIGEGGMEFTGILSPDIAERMKKRLRELGVVTGD